jgi:thiol-disulfide isomerase/thioredoxin
MMMMVSFSMFWFLLMLLTHTFITSDSFPYTTRYISTLTRSQEIVLKEGILFAREPVLRYQKDLERVDEIFGKLEKQKTEDQTTEEEEKESEERYMCLPVPMNYGAMIQKLFDSKVIFPTDRNENGSHKNKDVFVRGCSFPDYAEIEIWPADSTDGATVRYGFPAIGELTLETKLEKMMGSAKKKSPAKKRPREKRVQENPFVLEVESLEDVKEDIVNLEKDAVLFVSAPYCKLCRSINPLFTRMARIYKEEKQSDLLFAKASSAGKEGKQLTFTLNIDSVPTFVLFKKGQRYGEPFGVVKLPSKKLDNAIDYLLNDKDWDSSVIGMETNVRRTKLK